MSVFGLVAVGVVMLSLAACRARRPSSKALLLASLLVILGLVWSYIVLALGVLSAHEFPEAVAKWPSPGILALVCLAYFTAISGLALLRKQD
jgi:hypothetical protein